MQADLFQRKPARWLALAAAIVLAAAGPLHAEPAGGPAAPVRAGSSGDSPITFVVTRYIRPGCEARFEALIHDQFRDGVKVPGNPTAEFLRPPEPDSHAYTTIFRFDRVADYRQWLESPERQEWLARSAPLSDGPPQFQYRSGMEVWVTPPEEQGFRSPPTYKTVALNFVALYPVYYVMRWALAPVTAGWDPLTATALRTGVAVVLAGYGVMPHITRAFRGWLFPPDETCKAG